MKKRQYYAFICIIFISGCTESRPVPGLLTENKRKIELHEENRDLFIIKNNISKKLHEEEYDLIKKYIPKLNYVL